jgi:hypothetical protein
MMYHHLMRFIILENVSLTHEMMTHHLGTNFWETNLGCVALSYLNIGVQIKKYLKLQGDKVNFPLKKH